MIFAPFSPFSSLSLRGRTIHALAGALIMGVLIPSILVWWHFHGRPFDHLGAKDPDRIHLWFVKELIALLFLAGLFCGPGALILGGILMVLQRKSAARFDADEGNAIWSGVWMGAALAFINLPGYFSFEFFASSPVNVIRVFMLFLVTGSTCGAWIAWQAYKEHHPERGILPRFSLRTLIFLALGWGGLLWLFRPA